MAEEIVKFATSPQTIDEIITRSKERIEPEPIRPRQPQPEKKMGLHREFTQRKLDEAETVKEILGE